MLPPRSSSRPREAGRGRPAAARCASRSFRFLCQYPVKFEPEGPMVLLKLLEEIECLSVSLLYPVLRTSRADCRDRFLDVHRSMPGNWLAHIGVHITAARHAFPSTSALNRASHSGLSGRCIGWTPPAVPNDTAM